MVNLKKLSELQIKRLMNEYPDNASYPGALERMVLVIWNYLNDRPAESIEEYSNLLKENAKKEWEKRQEEERKRRAEIEAKERKRKIELILKLKNWIVGLEEPIKYNEENGLLEWKCPTCGNSAKFDLKEHIDEVSKGGVAELIWYCSGKKSVEGPYHWSISRQIRLAQGEEISKKLLKSSGKRTKKD
jgi:hypothetical protein